MAFAGDRPRRSSHRLRRDGRAAPNPLIPAEAQTQGSPSHGPNALLTHDHVITQHMRRSGFDRSFLAAYWRWIDAGPSRDFTELVAKN
jgi:hypothetical protein